MVHIRRSCESRLPRGGREGFKGLKMIAGGNECASSCSEERNIRSSRGLPLFVCTWQPSLHGQRSGAGGGVGRRCGRRFGCGPRRRSRPRRRWQAPRQTTWRGRARRTGRCAVGEAIYGSPRPQAAFRSCLASLRQRIRFQGTPWPRRRSARPSSHEFRGVERHSLNSDSRTPVECTASRTSSMAVQIIMTTMALISS